MRRAPVRHAGHVRKRDTVKDERGSDDRIPLCLFDNCLNWQIGYDGRYRTVPSSADTVTEQKIRKALLNICENRTSIIIAHRLSTIRDSDLIILLENGQIMEQGTHRELLALNRQYAAMYRTQTGRPA